MSRSRSNPVISNPSTLDSIKAKIDELKKWIYEKCKSKPVRYFVSALAGGGAALVVIGIGTAIGISGPVGIILAVAAFIAVGVRENQKLLAGQKVEEIREENQKLLAETREHHDEHEQLIETQAEFINELNSKVQQIEVELDDAKKTNLEVMSLLAKHASEEAKKEFEPLIKKMSQPRIKPSKQTTLSQLFPGPDLKFVPPVEEAPGFSAFNSMFTRPNLLDIPEAKPANATQSVARIHMALAENDDDPIMRNAPPVSTGKSALSESDTEMQNIISSLPPAERAKLQIKTTLSDSISTSPAHAAKKTKPLPPSMDTKSLGVADAVDKMKTALATINDGENSESDSDTDTLSLTVKSSKPPTLSPTNSFVSRDTASLDLSLDGDTRPFMTP